MDNLICRDELIIIPRRTWTSWFHYCLEQFLLHCRIRWIFTDFINYCKIRISWKEEKQFQTPYLYMKNHTNLFLSKPEEIPKGLWFSNITEPNSDSLQKLLMPQLYSKVLTGPAVPKHNILISLSFFIFLWFSLIHTTNLLQRNHSLECSRAIWENTTLTVELPTTHKIKKKRKKKQPIYQRTNLKGGS